MEGAGSAVQKRMRTKRLLGPAAAIFIGLVLAVSCAAPGAQAPLHDLKKSEFGNRALAEADLIGAGVAQPVLEFTVEDTPPSIFVNYVVPDAQAAAFESFIDLPPGFTLAKVQILGSDPAPRYWLSLNVYRVSGITTGLRAEWSTYVDDGSGTPRFMIVRARAAEGSVDPIGPIALPEPFGHSIDTAGVIHTDMSLTVDQGSGPVLTGDDLFHSTITLPDPADRHPVTPAFEWIAANDFIYWMNGVNDRTFHNATAHSAELISIDPADVTLDDQTEWMPYVDPVPAHVLVYLDKIEFMIGPWWNVTEPDGRVDPATLYDLSQLKKSMYGGLSTITALGVLDGTREPIAQSGVEANEPSTRWHWRIPAEALGDFEAAAGLPAGLTLAPVRLQDDDTVPGYWLTLNVRRQSGSEAGVRAEWSTYVDDGSGSGPRAVVLEVSADGPTLNPVDRFLAATPVQHIVAGSTLSTSVQGTVGTFESTITVPGPGAATVTPSREWVAAGELQYWSDGTADRVFSDSRSLAPVASVDAAMVTTTDSGRWAEFTAAGPDRVWLDNGGAAHVTNPWWKLGTG